MDINSIVNKYIKEAKDFDWSSMYKKSNYEYNDALDAIMYFFEGNKDDDNVFASGIYGFWKNRATGDKNKSELAYKAAEEELFDRESEVRSYINSGNTRKIMRIAKDVQDIINSILG